MRFRAAVLPALLCACGRTAAEREPNDHFTAATEAPVSGAVTGRLAAASDVDFYKLEVPRDGGTVSLALGGVRGVDFVVSFQDKDRLELKRVDETSTGGDEEALDLGVDKGVYYVVLSNKDPKAGASEQDYTLRLSYASGPGGEREPNDKPMAAQPVPAGGLLRGHFHPSRNLLTSEPDQPEEDWFRVQLDREGLYTLNIDLSEVPKVDSILEVYDSNAYKLKEVDLGGPGEAESLRNFGIKGPGQFLLRLRAKTRSSNADAPFELLTELIPYDGKAEFEPNDQRLDATPFAGASITGALSPPGDADWYAVTAAGEGRQLLRADLSAVDGTDLQLVLADELGNARLTVDNMGKEQPELLTGVGVSPGTYYLVVSEKPRAAAPGAAGPPPQAAFRRPYTLGKSLGAAPPGLEYEFNDSTGAAQAVKVGESVDGYLAPKGDVDCYEFNVYQKGTLAAEVTGILNVRPGLTLLDQDYRELLSAAAKRPGDPVSLEAELDAGTYLVRLDALDAGQNNVRDKYTLRLRMR